MIQHTPAARKVLKSRTDQHQVITGGGAAPSLADTVTLMAPYGVSFAATLSMVQGAHMRIRLVLVTLLGQDHPTALAMRDLNEEVM